MYLDGKIDSGVYRPLTLNLYNYTSWNPVNRIDPDGNADGDVRRYYNMSREQIQKEQAYQSGLLKGLAQDFLDGQAQALAEGMGFQNPEYVRSGIQLNFTKQEQQGREKAQGITEGVNTLMALGVLATQRDFEPSRGMIKGALSLLVQDGKIDASILSTFVPKNLRNSFVPNARIPAGQKYKFRIGEHKILIKWHSSDARWRGVAGANSGAGWTAQISVGREFLTTSGTWTRRVGNDTHIPITR